GSSTVEDFWTRSGLGSLMGTALVRVLAEAGLVTMHDEPIVEDKSFIRLRQSLVSEQTETLPAIPDSDIDDASESDESARNEIFALYTRLKPLVLPREVLGVSAFADERAIDGAYERLMKQLERSVPESSAQALMESRLEELRRKVTAAYTTLKAFVSST